MNINVAKEIREFEKIIKFKLNTGEKIERLFEGWCLAGVNRQRLLEVIREYRPELAHKIEQKENSANEAKILFVDDDQEAYLSAINLEKKIGEEVIFISDSTKALEILRKNKGFGVLITDGDMPPGMNGAELARAVRKFNPEIKIALISTSIKWQEITKDIPGITLFDKLELAVNSWKKLIDWLKR